MLLKCCYSLSPNCKSNLKLLSFYFRSWSNTNWGNKPSRSQNVYMDFHSFDWSLQRKPVTLRLSGKKQQRWWNDWAFAAAAVLDSGHLTLPLHIHSAPSLEAIQSLLRIIFSLWPLTVWLYTFVMLFLAMFLFVMFYLLCLFWSC